MTKNGEIIQDYFENIQLEISAGCDTYGHKFSRNGTLSCVRCGKTKNY